MTVLLAVHDGEPFLREAIGSVLEQRFGDFELLVIDDASTDGSGRTIASFDDARIRVVRNDVNVGLARSLNRGLSLVRSEYVARLDADDVALPGRLERQVAFLDAHPDVALVGAQGIPIDASGRRLRRVEWWHREWERPREGAELDWYRMFDTPFIHSSVMFRRAVVWDELGGYDEAFPLLRQDTELWMRLGRRTRMVNLDERLVAMRLTPRSVTYRRALHSGRALREQHIALLSAVMADVVGSDAVPPRCAATWVDVNDPESDVPVEAIRALHDDVTRLAARFPRERAIRLHRASLVARMIEKTAARRSAWSLRLLLHLLRLDPAGALRLLPRFALLLLCGDAPFRWRRARAMRRRPA